MKQKQRKFIKVGEINKCQEIDRFIPTAEQEANELHPDNSEPGYSDKWTGAFCEAMNQILFKEGLRVL
jgi:hypothetical protein